MSWTRFPAGTSVTVAKNLRDDQPMPARAGTSEDREATRTRDAGRFEGPNPAVFLFLIMIGIAVVGFVVLWIRGFL